MIKGFFIFLVGGVLTISALAQKKTTLKFLSYNALHGFSGDTVLMKGFVSWVKELDPDIVAFQEMNNYTQNEIGLLAERYGHPYAIIMNREFGVPNTHPIAITSRYPILSVSRVMDEMWHGYLYAYIEGLHIFVTHLAPFTLQDRLRDIRKIVAQAKLIPEDERVVIAGDLNALSPADSLNYGAELLESMRRIEGRLEPKSGTPIVRNRTIYRNNLNEGKIDYSVIQELEESGFKDTFYLHNSDFENSVPTKGHAKASSIPRRIDYIWVNEPLMSSVVRAEILHDETTAVLSDHYPVLVELDLLKKTVRRRK